jgi:glycosyltransferase involved in cell wall biosynthesis
MAAVPQTKGPFPPERLVLLRILMISPAYPFPPDNGAKRRILAAASYLAQVHDMTLVSIRESNSAIVPPSQELKGLWQEFFINQPSKKKLPIAIKAAFSTHSYSQFKYWNRNLLGAVGRMISTQSFDCIWVHFLFMTIYLERFFSENSSIQKLKRPIFLLDEHNVDELTYKNLFWNNPNLFRKIYAMLEILKAKRLQRRWFPRFDAILCVSPEDHRRTCHYVDQSTNVWLVPNGVDIGYFQPRARQDFPEDSPVIVFGGSLDVRMNQDAVLWFSGDILPIIKQKIPGMQFWIVGRDPTSEVKKLGEKPGIAVTGTVADVRDYYRQAQVFVVPLRFGGGTKLKTLEAMAMGLPIVSTGVGAQGLDINWGREIYIADRPEDFALRVIELLKDRDKADRMGEEARHLVEKKYVWNRIMEDMNNKLINLYKERGNRIG